MRPNEGKRRTVDRRECFSRLEITLKFEHRTLTSRRVARENMGNGVRFAFIAGHIRHLVCGCFDCRRVASIRFHCFGRYHQVNGAGHCYGCISRRCLVLGASLFKSREDLLVKGIWVSSAATKTSFGVRIAIGDWGFTHGLGAATTLCMDHDVEQLES